MPTASIAVSNAAPASEAHRLLGRGAARTVYGGRRTKALRHLQPVVVEADHAVSYFLILWNTKANSDTARSAATFQIRSP